MDFYRRTFNKAGALAFLGEAGAHILVLTTAFRLVDLPFFADWYFFILGTYCAIGMWLFSTDVQYRGCRWCFVYWFTFTFITGSVLLHGYIIFIARSHEILHIFHRWYSYIGLTYCIFYVWFLWTLKLRRTE